MTTTIIGEIIKIVALLFLGFATGYFIGFYEGEQSCKH